MKLAAMMKGNAMTIEADSSKELAEKLNTDGGLVVSKSLGVRFRSEVPEEVLRMEEAEEMEKLEKLEKMEKMEKQVVGQLEKSDGEVQREDVSAQSLDASVQSAQSARIPSARRRALKAKHHKHQLEKLLKKTDRKIVDLLKNVKRTRCWYDYTGILKIDPTGCSPYVAVMERLALRVEWLRREGVL